MISSMCFTLFIGREGRWLVANLKGETVRGRERKGSMTKLRDQDQYRSEMRVGLV